MKTFTMGSLFAGIGGFDLGFERAGFRTKWQVEIDPFATKVLAKNFPHAQRFGDIRTVGAHNLETVDVICSGFPCQDISNAGKRAGIEGARSGLVTEGIRVIRELRPRFVLLENVAALLARGLGEVIGYLAEVGYDAEWEIVSAADAGAPHLRQRVWILAYPARELFDRSRIVSYEAGRHEYPDGGSEMANAFSIGQSGLRELEHASCPSAHRERKAGDAFDVRIGEEWLTEPNVGRVAHGIPARVDRLRCLGNAVVPQIPELFARRIRQVMEAQ